MEVKINSWDGVSFQNDNICHFCQKKSTTVIINKISICKGCLWDMIKKIAEAILKFKAQLAASKKVF